MVAPSPTNHTPATQRLPLACHTLCLNPCIPQNLVKPGHTPWSTTDPEYQAFVKEYEEGPRPAPTAQALLEAHEAARAAEEAKGPVVTALMAFLQQKYEAGGWRAVSPWQCPDTCAPKKDRVAPHEWQENSPLVETPSPCNDCTHTRSRPPHSPQAPHSGAGGARGAASAAAAAAAGVRAAAAGCPLWTR